MLEHVISRDFMRDMIEIACIEVRGTRSWHNVGWCIMWGKVFAATEDTCGLMFVDLRSDVLVAVLCVFFCMSGSFLSLGSLIFENGWVSFGIVWHFFFDLVLVEVACFWECSFGFGLICFGLCV